jgi:hypothetical protein
LAVWSWRFGFVLIEGFASCVHKAVETETMERRSVPRASRARYAPRTQPTQARASSAQLETAHVRDMRSNTYELARVRDMETCTLARSGRCRSAYAVVRRARLHIARGPCTPDKSLSMHRCCHASCCRASSCCRSCCRASLSLLVRCREREGAPFTQARPASAARTLEP